MAILLGGLCSLPAATRGSLSAAEVIQRASERTQGVDSDRKPDYTYTKVSVTEHLDPAGRVKQHKEKVWQVLLQNGTKSARLLEVNGRPPKAGDLKMQNENESKMHELLGRSNAAKTKHGRFLDPEIVSRFDFTLRGETVISGRRAYELAFQPKVPEVPEHHLVDRLLNRISGTLWIDAEEFELARADIHLQTEVDVLGGLAGCLKKLDYRLTRTRVAEGIWLNESASGDFEGRKLLEPMRVRTRSHVSNFRLLAGGQHSSQG